MKNILLLSTLRNNLRILKKIIPNIKKKSLTYITTASKVNKIRLYTKINKLKLKWLGIRVDEVDVSTVSYEIIKEKIEKNDCIYVASGNTFYLLQELKRTKSDQLIINEVNKGKLYIGESAGTVVACPNIEYIEKMDSLSKAPFLNNYDGLNIVNIYVLPHENNVYFKKVVQKIKEEYSNKIDLFTLRDNEALLIEDIKIKKLKI